MRLINLVHISLEAWGTLFSLIAAIFVIISPDTNRIRQKHLFIMLLMGGGAYGRRRSGMDFPRE